MLTILWMLSFNRNMHLAREFNLSVILFFRKIVDHVDYMTSAEQMAEYVRTFRLVPTVCVWLVQYLKTKQQMQNNNINEIIIKCEPLIYTRVCRLVQGKKTTFKIIQVEEIDNNNNLQPIQGPADTIYITHTHTHTHTHCGKSAEVICRKK